MGERHRSPKSTDHAFRRAHSTVAANRKDGSQAPPSITITSATARDGRPLHFVHNWSWEPATIRIPTPVRDLLAAAEHDVDQDVTLSAWDVRIFAER